MMFNQITINGLFFLFVGVDSSKKGAKKGLPPFVNANQKSKIYVSLTHQLNPKTRGSIKSNNQKLFVTVGNTNT